MFPVEDDWSKTQTILEELFLETAKENLMMQKFTFQQDKMRNFH